MCRSPSFGEGRRRTAGHHDKRSALCQLFRARRTSKARAPRGSMPADVTVTTRYRRRELAMTGERWHHIETLFEQAFDLAGSERGGYPTRVNFLRGPDRELGWSGY